MNNDTMKDIINDVRDLASVSDAMTRIGLDGIANRLKKLLDDSLPDSETPSSESNADEDKSGSYRCGFVGNKTTSVYYNFLDNLDIQVTAREIKTGQWTIEGRNRTEVRIVATVFGGRDTANKFARFIRDGMVLRSMKIKRDHKRRAERMSEAANKEVA